MRYPYMWLAIGISLGVVLSALGCSDAVDPAMEKECTIDLRVTVLDTFGNVVPNARIYLSPGNGANPQFLDVTNSDGVCQTIISGVPFKGSNYTLRIAEPENDRINYPQPSGETLLILLSCCDTSIVSRSIIADPPRCDGSRRDYNLALRRCVDDPNAATSQSLVIPCRTGCDVLTFEIVQAQPTPPASSRIRINGNPFNGNTTVVVMDGRNLQMEMSHSEDVELFYTGSVAYTARCNDTICFFGTISVVLDAYHEDDNCPPTDTTYRFDRKIPVCTSSSLVDTLRIGYSNYFNDKASLVLEVKENFTHASEISLLPFKQDIDPKRVLEFVRVNFEPKRPGTYLDSLIFRVKKRNSYGKLEDCDQTIKIVVSYIAIDPALTIRLSNDIQRCMGLNFAPMDSERDSTSTITLENTSSCLFKGPIRFALSGDDARYFSISPPSPIGDMPPHSKRNILVDIKIKPTDIWDFSSEQRKAIHSTTFIAFLTVTADGPPSVSEIVPLKVHIDTTCFCPKDGPKLTHIKDPADTLGKYSGYKYKQNSSRWLEVGRSSDVSLFAFYETAISPNSHGGDGTATIESATGTFINVTSLIPGSSECVCDLMNRSVYLVMQSFVGGSNKIIVRKNEFYLWRDNNRQRFMLVEFMDPHYDKFAYISFYPCSLLVWGN